MSEPVRYSDSVNVRCQPEVVESIQRIAHTNGQKPAETARQALRIGLQTLDANKAVA